MAYTKPFAWSYSALTGFELCPKKHAAEKVYKQIPYEQNEAAKYGETVHKHFENRLLKATPLPLDLRHHEPVMLKLYDAPGEGLPEQRLTLTRDLQPTGWFDDDAWCRGIVDYTKINGGSALIVDHKTGRMQDGFDQLDLMYAMMTAHMPEILSGRGAFYWTKTKRMPNKKYIQSDVSTIWAAFLPRVKRMEEAQKKEDFPAKPNFLCKSYCKVTNCPYHGV